MPELHRGKIVSNPKILAVRPLTRDDLACLRDKRPPQGVTKVFKDHHHRIARLTAMGLRPAEVQAQCGLSATRWVQLKDDPAFQELVAQYRKKVDERYVDTATELFERVSANTLNAEILVSERLELALEGGEDIPLKTLLAISRDGADRVGLPKQKVTSNTNVNLDFAAMLEAAAKRSGRSNVIDAVPNRAVSGPKAATAPYPLPSALPKPASATVAGPIRRRA